MKRYSVEYDKRQKTCQGHFNENLVLQQKISQKKKELVETRNEMSNIHLNVTVKNEENQNCFTNPHMEMKVLQEEDTKNGQWLVTRSSELTQRHNHHFSIIQKNCKEVSYKNI